VVIAEQTPDQDSDIQIVTFEPGMTARCESILASLPEWFGAFNEVYIRDLAHLHTFVAQRDDSLAGFLTLREHYPEAWEIHCLAVERSSHRRGIGRRLVRHSEEWLRARSVTVLHVKTVAPSRSDPFYARTLEFYCALGFHRVFETTAIWGPDSPCLVLVKFLRRLDATGPRGPSE
jgi:ribosomal protein S18 acetylase RimI-like enzyme